MPRMLLSKIRRPTGYLRWVFVAWCLLAPLRGAETAETVEHPFRGVTAITRNETFPRNLRMHVIEIDLATPGLRFELTAPGGSMETIRRTTLAFLREKQAQIAINIHFFLPFPSSSPDADLIGLAASNGNVYSAFEVPVQSYALVALAPAINIDATNHASIVHWNPTYLDHKHVRERVTLWTVIAGSAQIVTDGVKTIPVYKDANHPEGQLSPGGPGNYSNAKSWYDVLHARTAIGLTRDNRTLVLFTADLADGSMGMKVGEVADVLIQDYAVANALNLDGGGSTSLAMESPATHAGVLVNASEDNSGGRSVGSNLAIFMR